MPDASQQVNKNLGILIFGRKRPGFDQEWNAMIRTQVLDFVRQLGFNPVGAAAPVLDDQGIHAALDSIEQAKCDALIIIQPSLTDGQFAFTISQRWQDPLILWATPERPTDGKVSSCSLVGQNLWASLLRQAHRPFEFVYGAPGAVKDELLRAIALTSAIRKLRRSKIGVVGTHAPGFIDLAADPFLIRKTFGMQLHSLSMPQFIDRVHQVPDAAVQKDLAKVHKLGLLQTGTKSAPPDEMLAPDSRFYISMTELMQEAGLDALALQCWPELPNIFKQWPYFAISRLSAEGRAVSVEGDIDGALASYISTLLGMGPGFLTDWLEHDEETIFFWHPGMAPLDMCNGVGTECEPTLGEHFNGARPSVVDGPLQTGGPVTVSRIWRCDDRYHITAFEGHAIPPRRNVSGNSLLMEVPGGKVPQRFEKLIHAGLPHHVILHFGHWADSFERLARLLSLEWHS